MIAFKKEDGRLASSLLNMICCQKWYQIFMHYMDQVGISFISVFIWIYTFFSRNSTRVILAMSHHTIRVSNDLNQAIFTTFPRNTIFVGAIQVKAIIPIIFGIFSSLPCSWVISKLVGFVPEKLENWNLLGYITHHLDRQKLVKKIGAHRQRHFWHPIYDSMPCWKYEENPGSHLESTS